MQLVFSFTHCKQLVAQNYGDTDDPQIGRAFYVTKVASVDKDYILFLNHWFSSQKIYEKMLLMLWLLLFIIFFKVYFPSNKLKQFQTAFKHFKVQLLKSILFTLVTTPITHKKWVWVCGGGGEGRNLDKTPCQTCQNFSLVVWKFLKKPTYLLDPPPPSPSDFWEFFTIGEEVLKNGRKGGGTVYKQILLIILK